MSIIQQKIRFTGNDLNIQVPISSIPAQLGLQQEINNYVLEKTTGSINAVTDVEVLRFQYLYSGHIMEFAFNTGGTYYTYFTAAGFTEDEVDFKSLNYLNSFFILDFFDSTSSANQTKIFSAYLTNISDNATSAGYSRYNVVPSFQLYDLNIPANFFTGTGDVYTAYARLSFYNAKTGKIVVFFNKVKDSIDPPPTNEKMYFEIRLNKGFKNWYVVSGSREGSTIAARELTTSPAYVDRYNNTFEDFENQQQDYPKGSIFIDGTYYNETGGTTGGRTPRTVSTSTPRTR